MEALKGMVSFLKDRIQENVDEHLADDQKTAEEDDDPRQSAAALAISLNFNDKIESKPTPACHGVEFTHQCFEGEFIPGYQPFDQDIKERMLHIDPENPAAHHDSHQHFETAEEFLRIKVQLAPSCRKCKVTFHTEPKNEIDSNEGKSLPSSSSPNINKENEAKRRKINDGVFTKNDTENGEKTNTASSEEAPKMPLPQVLECLSKMLPEIVDGEEVESDYLPKPFGVVLYEYNRGEEQYCVCLANGSETEGVAEYHHSVQRLALGWIETADGIDVTYKPHAGQHWQILYLFQKHSLDQYSLAGFMTLWSVLSPFFKPQPGRVLRIAQALLLPHRQRRGHGLEMMRTIYKLAQGEYDSKLFQKEKVDDEIWNLQPIVQVNVEDPSPSFTSLRDLVDLELFLDPERAALLNNESNDESFCALKEPALTKISSEAKITPKQVQIVHELFGLRKLLQQKKTRAAVAASSSNKQDDDDDDDDDEEEKSFRLAVKERLYLENKAEISTLQSKDDMRTALSNLYNDQRAHYTKILAKADRSIGQI